MKLSDIIPDPDSLLALEPDELGLRMLPVLGNWKRTASPLKCGDFIRRIVGDRQSGYPGQYPDNRADEIEQAIREAWAWLEGQALLVFDPGWIGPHEIRKLRVRLRMG